MHLGIKHQLNWIANTIVCLLLALFAITFSHAHAADVNPRLADLQTVNLQLKWRHQFQFAGYYAAQAKGFYLAEGLSVNII